MELPSGDRSLPHAAGYPRQGWHDTDLQNGQKRLYPERVRVRVRVGVRVEVG